MNGKSKQSHHLNKGFFEPVRSLLHSLASLGFWALGPIENEYREGVRMQKPTEAVKEGTHFGVLACVVVTVVEHGAALDEP
jgi:hypothetical protein